MIGGLIDADNRLIHGITVLAGRLIVENQKLFKTLTSSHSRPNFRQFFKMIMKNNFTQRFHAVLMATKDKELLKKEYIIESLISGNLGMIIHWIQSDINISPVELAELISYTVLKSPLDN